MTCYLTNKNSPSLKKLKEKMCSIKYCLGNTCLRKLHFQLDCANICLSASNSFCLLVRRV